MRREITKVCQHPLCQKLFHTDVKSRLYCSYKCQQAAKLFRRKGRDSVDELISESTSSYYAETYDELAIEHEKFVFSRLERNLHEGAIKVKRLQPGFADRKPPYINVDIDDEDGHTYIYIPAPIKDRLRKDPSKSAIQCYNEILAEIHQQQAPKPKKFDPRDILKRNRPDEPPQAPGNPSTT